MTITATYNGDLARVQVAITGLPVDVTTVKVERSTNLLFWQTVRGAAQLPVTGGAAQVDDFEFADGTLTHYRWTPVDPPAGLRLDGSAGTYASTPSDPALNVTGDLELRAEFQMDVWPPQAEPRLIAKFGTTSDQCSYQLRLLSTGHANLVWSVTGAAAGAPGRSSTVPVPAVAGQTIGVAAKLDVDDGAGNHVVIFYYSHDWVTWIQLGDPVPTVGPTSIYASSTPVSIGARTNPEGNPFTGTVTRAEIRGAASAVVADPDFTEQPTGTTNFVDTAGRTWTLSGNAVIIASGETTTITPSLGGEIWLKSIRFSFLNRPIRVLNFGDVQRPSRSGVFEVQGRSVPISVHDLRGSQQFELEVATRDFDDDAYDALIEDRNLDLVLAAGGTYFIHVPAGEEVPGGYVTIGNTSARRIAPGRGMTRLFTLPCTVTAPPGPGVVGSTMTYGALINLYGSYEAVLAANPTYADLLSLMASPDDLVVL